MTFIVFILANIYIKNNYEDTYKVICQAAVGIANGVIIFIFTEIYKNACIKAVELENHKFESSFENSYIFKRSFFEFILSYVNLGYYAFYLRDFKLLSRNFITIIITKNLLFGLKVKSLDKHFTLNGVLVEEESFL